jgi:hypothetical protein
VPRKEFLDAINGGATNRELANMFSLTPRQANGLRIGLARRKSHKHFTASVDGKPLDRSKQQEACPGQNALRSEPIERVVRFLRQAGDVVVRSGEKFLVNARHVLTMMELIEYANRKAMDKGHLPFSMEAPLRQT